MGDELKKEAKRRGLKGYYKLQKDQLIQLLNDERIESLIN